MSGNRDSGAVLGEARKHHLNQVNDQRGPLGSAVWIFHGDHARYASGVFDTLDAGLAWAAEHQVTGILADYPHGGAFDVAVSESRFTPSKAHHGTAEHVAAFSPGYVMSI